MLQVRRVIIPVLTQDLKFVIERVLKAIVKPLEQFEKLLLDIETERTNVDRSANLVSAESPFFKPRR